LLNRRHSNAITVFPACQRIYLSTGSAEKPPCGKFATARRSLLSLPDEPRLPFVDDPAFLEWRSDPFHEPMIVNHEHLHFADRAVAVDVFDLGIPIALSRLLLERRE